MAEPLLDAYPAVDWSAANAPKTGQDSIWLALAGRNGDGGRRLAWPALWELPARGIEDDAANRSSRFEVAERLSGRLGWRPFRCPPAAPGDSRLRCLDPKKPGDACRHG